MDNKQEDQGGFLGDDPVPGVPQPKAKVTAKQTQDGVQMTESPKPRKSFGASMKRSESAKRSTPTQADIKNMVDFTQPQTKEVTVQAISQPIPQPTLIQQNPLLQQARNTTKPIPNQQPLIKQQIIVWHEQPQSSLYYSQPGIEENKSCFQVKESQRDIYGHLYLTDYKMKFTPQKQRTEQDFGLYDIPYGYVLRYEEEQGRLGNSAWYLNLTLKDARTFKFKYENHVSFKKTIQYIEQHSYTQEYRNFTCMLMRDKLLANKAKLIGHYQIKQAVEQDFKRMGISTTTERFNQLQGTYNSELPTPCYAPSSIGQNQLGKEQEIRTKGRLPTVTYVHSKGCNTHKPKGLGCSIWRSAEPKTELNTQPCREDEAYIAAISQTFQTSVENKSKPSLWIFTARPDNTERGVGRPGFEHVKVYPNIQRNSYNQNYDLLKQSFKQLQIISHTHTQNNLPGTIHKDFMFRVAQSGWLDQVENILTAAQKVYRVVHELHGNALIYCNQGSSGTSVLSSLAQIMCDPYYRTFEGFKILVHKEWIFYKHNFALKSQMLREFKPMKQQQRGYLEAAQDLIYGDQKIKDVEPLFILFLDAVFQLTQTNPLSFEFNSKFLAHLAKELFTGRHFEFVQNGRPLGPNDATPQSEPEALSVFDDISDEVKRTVFHNKGYISVDHAAEMARVKPLNLKVCIKSIKYWQDYYGRFEPLEQLNNTILQENAKSLNLFHMKNANTTLINRVTDKLSQFHKKRAELTEGVFPNHLIEEYEWVLSRMQDLNRSQIPQKKLRQLRHVDIPSPSEPPALQSMNSLFHQGREGPDSSKRMSVEYTKELGIRESKFQDSMSEDDDLEVIEEEKQQPTQTEAKSEKLVDISWEVTEAAAEVALKQEEFVDNKADESWDVLESPEVKDDE